MLKGCSFDPISATVVWRFDFTRMADEQADQIIATIQSILGEKKRHRWSLRFIGRNWVLSPLRVMQLEDSGRFRTDKEVNNYIAQEDADFFKMAHVDLVEISNAFSMENTSSKRSAGKA